MSGLHVSEGRDPLAELKAAINFQETGESYLFTGHRGSGKTVELKRLSLELERECGCVALYVDMSDYVNETEPIGTGDLLVALMGALSEAFNERYRSQPLTETYWERFKAFMQREVDVSEVKLSAGVPSVVGKDKLASADVKLALKANPTFKQQVRTALDGSLEKFVRDARAFADLLVSEVRDRENDTARKVVVLTDSLERIRGVGAKAEQVYASFSETFFGNHQHLRFNLLHVVYSVPPILPLIAPGIGAHFGGGVFGLPQVKVEATPSKFAAAAPAAGARARHGAGIDLMVSLVTSRVPHWKQIFTADQLKRLAFDSGGNVRIFFALTGRVLLKAQAQGVSLPLADDTLLTFAENDMRAEMPLTDQDRVWLARVAKHHDMGLEEQKDLGALARLFDNHLILDYRNGRPWYDVLPLVREGLSAPA